jgi:hypothetical protein
MLYAWYRGNFRKYSFSHPGAGIRNIFRNFRTSKDVIRVVEYVHKISRAKRPTMRLHGRVKRDCHQTVWIKIPLKSRVFYELVKPKRVRYHEDGSLMNPG